MDEWGPILIAATLGLVAILFLRRDPGVLTGNEPMDVAGRPISSYIVGPANLMANQPFLFTPPIGLVLPDNNGGAASGTVMTPMIG
jgi:hypothetical protein